MSDSILKLTPRDPYYIPSIDPQRLAVQVLNAHMPNAESVTAQTSEAGQFIDAGENWGIIRCPTCSAVLDDDWWAAAMNDCAEHTPCCAAPVSLNDLTYQFEVAFGRFVLEVRNPGVTILDDALRQQMEAGLGCVLKVIWAYV